MKIAVVGSREYPDMEGVRRFIRALPKDVVVISGGARGVDSVAEEEARVQGLTVEIYPADWARYGRRAGYVRNKIMVDKADKVVAFWDGKSKGTKHTIDLARKASKPLCVFDD